jgi:hypothetical protein
VVVVTAGAAARAPELLDQVGEKAA